LIEVVDTDTVARYLSHRIAGETDQRSTVTRANGGETTDVLSNLSAEFVEAFVGGFHRGCAGI